MKNETKVEFLSLNDKLLNEFSIEELESRLETDPLVLATMFAGTEMAAGKWCFCNPIFCKPNITYTE